MNLQLMLPHVMVALASLGMAAAFLFADRESPTSRALALGLASMGVGIFLNFNFIQFAASAPSWSGWLSLPEGLSIAAFLEWLLRVRRTVPSGTLDVRGGDLLLRWGQLSAAVYVLVSLRWPEMRNEDFLGAIAQGRVVFGKSEFWRFAGPVLFSSSTGFLATLLLLNRRPDVSEKLRVFGFMGAAPLLIAGFVLPIEYAALSVMLGLMVLLIGATQYHVLQGQRGQFMSRFLSPQVAQLVNQRGLKSAMQQAHVELTVVCCDLRGFTRYASAHPSSRVIEVLRDYYDVVGKVVAESGGTIKDYAGDGILILVGAPLPVADHAAVGIAMADRIRDVGSAFTERWQSRKARLGIGVGVASGFVTVGVIGSASRLEYTAVGPAVNLASRLCEEAEHREILIAPRSVELAPNERLRPRSARGIKGFDELTRVFALPD